MKKLISLFLVAVMLLSFCACGKESEDGGETVATRPAPTVQVVEGQAIEQLDNVSAYFGVTGRSQALADLPAYTYNGEVPIKFTEMGDGRYGEKFYVFTETDAAAYINYLNALEIDGWVQYSNNIIEGTNLFATYTKGEGSVYCYYISAKKTTYIIKSLNQNLEPREQDNQYETVCTPILTQTMLQYIEWPAGMGYIIRLADGRFILIDGGYMESNGKESERLYAILERQNVLDKITIAAWIITHPHGDHLGVTNEFMMKYKPEDVEIQQFIFNFPNNADLEVADPIVVNDTNNPTRMPTFFLVKDMLWKDVPVTVCHTGQVYHFADAKIEFIHTHEDFAPKKIYQTGEDPVNGTSSVFRVEIAGQTTMFYGDASIGASADMVKMWGSYLKSDIMQANHHGLNGGSVPLYENTDPTVVMVPSSAREIPSILRFEYSRWIWNNKSGNIKEVMLSGWGHRELDLPYQVTDDTPFFPKDVKDPWYGKAADYKEK